MSHLFASRKIKYEVVKAHCKEVETFPLGTYTYRHNGRNEITKQTLQTKHHAFLSI